MRTVAEGLSRDLQQYAENPTDQDRDNDLINLCKITRGIKSEIDKHPANWTFGSWDVKPNMQFPSVLRDGKEVEEAKIRMSAANEIV
jgi:hypothetical protein